MKKKLLFFYSAMLVAMVIGVSVNLNLAMRDSVSTLYLFNLNALTTENGSTGESGYSANKVTCYNSYTSCWYLIGCKHSWRCASQCYDIKHAGVSDEGYCS